MHRFEDGEGVIVYNLGDGKEYHALVFGCVTESHETYDGYGIYILSPVGEPWRAKSEYPFTMCLMTDACIRKLDQHDAITDGSQSLPPNWQAEPTESRIQ
jgi:hypothetical protein